jgi:hypothetical protein
MSQQQFDQAKMNYDSTNASEKAAAASITQAQAQASQKKAAVAVAQTNLRERCALEPSITAK